MAVDRGAGYAHDEAEVRAQAVVGPQDRRPQGVAAHRSMAALEARQEAALDTARLAPDELLEDLRVPALLGRHAGAGSLRLLDVDVLVGLFLRCDGGEHEFGPQPPRDRAEHAASPGHATRRDA